MKIGIIGAGAIGGYVGARLALAGHAVTFIVRGKHVAAIERQGIKLIEANGEERVAPAVAAVEDYDRAGAQDILVLAVKANQLTPVATRLAPLLASDTAIVTMQNGIPFWYFQRHGGPLEGRRVRSVDPEGSIAANIPADRVIGCVVYPACELVEPGVVRHVEGDRFPVGELDGAVTERVTRVSECFGSAGLRAPILPNVREEIWLKLWGNLTFNPVSALTRSTLVDICRDEGTRALAAAMMSEAQAVAQKLGIGFRVSIERRILGAERVGAHKTSMLQDLEAGRELEIDALLGSVLELARFTDTPTPHLDTVYALCKRLDAAARS